MPHVLGHGQTDCTVEQTCKRKNTNPCTADDALQVQNMVLTMIRLLHDVNEPVLASSPGLTSGVQVLVEADL